MTCILYPMTRPARPTIVEELKQTRPFASRAQEATVALLRTTDMVRRKLSKVVEAEGITLQQYNVLRILRGAQGDPLCALEIRDRLIEETPGVSRLIERLVSKALVRRDRSSDDRRMLECFITGKGLDLLARLDARVDQADADVLRGLSSEQLETLTELLAEIREANR
jgi:DNA-binding MarR family transcriptional regulator